MSLHKCLYKYNRMFVPNHILAKLAKAGFEEARLSVIQSEKIRKVRRANTRYTSVVDMEFTESTTTQAVARKTYDSEGQWEQRVKLVRNEGDPPTFDVAVNHVYDSAGTVRDYFKNKLNRNSIDNLGMNLILNVHYGKNYMNAFWDGDEMTFGDGDGEIFISFTQSIEVVAHEMAHGVVQHTANLEYFSQSGALNEHFCDVLGSAINQYANGQTADDADWLIGNEIMGPTLYGEAIRSMKAPGTAYDNKLLGTDSQADHMKDYYTGPEDNGGVHINSGIPNKAFYLVAMEIGTDKAALIWYNALEKLWATANFNDAVDVIVNSARLLTKEEKVPLGTTQTVRAAFKETGLPQ